MDFNYRLKQSNTLITKLRDSVTYYRNKGDFTLAHNFEEAANEIQDLVTISKELKQRLISITGKEPT